MSDLFLDAPAASGQGHRPGEAKAPERELSQVPLAEAMRPRRLDEVVGQQHLLGPGAPFAPRSRQAIRTR